MFIFLFSAILRQGDRDASSTSLSLKLPTLPSPDAISSDMSPADGQNTSISIVGGAPSTTTPHYRQHGRNRSLDSAQVQSYLYNNAGNGTVLDGLQLSPLQLQLVSTSSKSHSPSLITNDRILSLKQQNLCHHCRHHRGDYENGISSPDSQDQPQLPSHSKLKCTCTTSSDDSGICSGASGTTGSETDDVNSTVAGENCEDFQNDESDAHDFNCESPRLSFDSAIMTDEHDGSEEHNMFEESTDSVLLNANFNRNTDLGSQDNLDLERTLTEISFTQNTSSPSAELERSADHCEPSDHESLSENSQATPVSVPPTGNSLFSRIRVNSKGNKSQANNSNVVKNPNSSVASVTSPNAGTSTISSNIAAGMRNKLRLNFGKEKNKSKCNAAAVIVNTSETTKPLTPTSASGMDSKVSSDASITVNPPVSVASQSLCANFRVPTPSVQEEEESATTSECDIDIVRPISKLLEPKSWLLRFFESQVFNMSYAIGYLFTSKEPGVQQYIGTCLSCCEIKCS
jgi:hypothetical protein